MMDLSQVLWRKSSRSNANGGQCVEIGVWHKSTHGGNGPDGVAAVHVDNAQHEGEREADAAHLILIRDSKDPDGLPLAISPSEWGVLLSGIKDGAFAGLA